MEQPRVMPRIVVAGLGGGSGKTIVSMALLLAARRAGLATRAFKKGPDYIDAAWLGWASDRGTRNLDTWLMGFDGAFASFVRNSTPEGLNLVEGNRGVFDGMPFLVLEYLIGADLKQYSSARAKRWRHEWQQN